MKSRIGPLALEAPLGERTGSGQVFRAIHVEQRKLLAVRVFPIPLGLTPESRQEFAAQLEDLKQLRHPHIVRCYGGGFDSRTAYLVYELIDGQSLDTVLARRHRLPWDTALEYGQQLADALQYAHLMGWVHGRIRPEKLLISHADTAQAGPLDVPKIAPVKLTDFRREAIASAIGGQPPGSEELMFMAPELLAADAVPDEKCDLYSLGAVLYTMLTGQPPITARNVPELMESMQRCLPTSVQAQVLDCPIWLSAIIDQLLAKDPQQRPYGAAALLLALKEAERRQSAGVGVLQHATSGFSPLQLKQADRQEAEKVLGIKRQKERRASELSLWENAWVLGGLLVACIGLAVWLLLPLSQKTLRSRAEQLLASREEDDWQDAREFYLRDLVERFAETEDAQWAQTQIDFVDSVDAEHRLDRMARLNRTPKREIERRYLEAWRYEKFGDRVTAVEMYRSMITLLSDEQADRAVVTLAKRRIAELESSPLDAAALRQLLVAKLEQAGGLFEKGSVSAAREIWESMVTLYGDNQELAEPVAQAREKLEALAK